MPSVVETSPRALHEIVTSLEKAEGTRRELVAETEQAFERLGELLATDDGELSARLATLKNRHARGLASSAEHAELVESVRAWIAESFAARIGGDDDSSTSADDVVSLLDELAPILDQAGVLTWLFQRQAEADAAVSRARVALAKDMDAAELVELTLSASASARGGEHGALRFLVAAEQRAEADPELLEAAKSIRALRLDLVSAEVLEQTSEELSDSLLSIAMTLDAEHDRLDRELGDLAMERGARQAENHGLAKLDELSADARHECDRLTEQLAAGAVEEATMQALARAFIRRGLVLAWLEVGGITVARSQLDVALRELSGRLGALVSDRSIDDSMASSIDEAWEDLAEVDADLIEGTGHRVLSMILGMSPSEGGVLPVIGETPLSALGDDGRVPMADFQEVAKSERIRYWNILGRLQALGMLLEEHANENAKLAAGALAHYVSVLAPILRQHFCDLEEVLAPSGALRKLADVGATIHGLMAAAHDENSTPTERWDLLRQALARLCDELASAPQLISCRTSLLHWEAEVLEKESRMRADQAVCLSALRQLHAITFGKPSPSCMAAMDLALALRDDRDGAMEDMPDMSTAIDHVTSALEALHLEKKYLEHLRFPCGSGHRMVSSLAAHRNGRLRDVYGTSLTLLFELLNLLVVDFEGTNEGEREAYLDWYQSLLVQAHSELGNQTACLDESLFDLSDNTERLHHYGVVFVAYHQWARRTIDSELGEAMLERRGEMFFEQFESLLSTLGETVLDQIESEPTDWRSLAILESLQELYRAVVSLTAEHPTLTDISSELRALSERAAAMREQLSERVEVEEGNAVPAWWS